MTFKEMSCTNLILQKHRWPFEAKHIEKIAFLKINDNNNLSYIYQLWKCERAWLWVSESEIYIVVGR